MIGDNDRRPQGRVEMTDDQSFISRLVAWLAAHSSFYRMFNTQTAEGGREERPPIAHSDGRDAAFNLTPARAPRLVSSRRFCMIH